MAANPFVATASGGGGGSSAAVRRMLDEFEFYKSRRLAPTLMKSPRAPDSPRTPRPTTAAEPAGAAVATKNAALARKASIAREEQRRIRDEIKQRVALEEVAGRGGSGEAKLVELGGKSYLSFAKPMDVGPSPMIRWLLDVKELRSADLVLALRDAFRFSELPQLAALDAAEFRLWWDRCPLSKLQLHWLKHCSKNAALTMPNATVAFVGFLKAALPECYIDKRQAEQLYNLLNDRRNTQLSFVAAFVKLGALLLEVDDSCEEEFAQFFFSFAFNVFQPSHFVTALDFQTIVSSFEELVELSEAEAAERRGVAVSQTAAVAGGVGGGLAGLIDIFRRDIMRFALKQPLRQHIHVSTAVQLLDASTFLRYAKNGYIEKFTELIRAETNPEAWQAKLSPRGLKPTTSFALRL